MKIKCHLSRIMGAKRLTIKEVSEKAGLARNTVGFLYNEQVSRIDFSSLAKLCEVLNCQVGDILEAVPDEIVDGEESVEEKMPF